MLRIVIQCFIMRQAIDVEVLACAEIPCGLVHNEFAMTLAGLCNRASTWAACHERSLHDEEK